MLRLAEGVGAMLLQASHSAGYGVLLLGRATLHWLSGEVGRAAEQYHQVLDDDPQVIYIEDDDPDVIYVEQAPAGEVIVEAAPAAPVPRPAQGGELNRAADYYLSLGDRSFRDGRYADAVHF